MNSKLTDFVTAERVILDLRKVNRLEVLRELADFAHDKGLVPDSTALYEGLLARENLISTGTGDGVAIPHAHCEGVDRIFLIFARSEAGVDFDSLDGEPVHLFVTIVGPKARDGDQLKVLSRTARLLKNAEFRESFLAAETEQDALLLIRASEAGW